ncbi:MAG: DUF4340 domain-containing protein [Verrucomicrobiae bacterium]|nr:DUF4340 domain-containing protein [Verrucomicrobiae bacterium]
MGQKALIRLLIIFVVIGAIALVVKLVGTGNVQTVASSTDREKVFDNFPINDVAQIRIKTSAEELNLKKSADSWTVAERGDYPATPATVVGLLRSIWDLKVVQSPEIGESQYSRLSLLDPTKGGEGTSATVISFMDASGKELSALWLGKVVERESGQPSPYGPSTTEAGRYVKTGSEPTVYLVSETFSDIETDPAGWLNEDFFKIEKVKTIAIQTGNPEDDWKLVREDEDGDFTLVDGKDDEELDPVKVGAMKNAFSSPRFEDVLVGDAAKENAPDKTTFVIEAFNGFKYTVKVGEKTDLNEYSLTYDVEASFPDKRKPGEEETEEEAKERDAAFASALGKLQAKIAAEKAMAGKVYKVREYVVNPFLKKRSELLKSAEAPEAGNAGPTFTPGAMPTGPDGSPINIPGLPAGMIPSVPKAPKGAAPGAMPAEKKELPNPPKTEKEAPKPATAEKPKADSPKADSPKPAEEKKLPAEPAPSPN